jgi:tetratricopeptide (TPR) repeat protein
MVMVRVNVATAVAGTPDARRPARLAAPRASCIFPSDMRLTSSFAVFRYEPGEKVLAKARWFSRDGKAAEAEQEYRAALGADPDLRSGWLELFELLRRHHRLPDALELTARAEAHFGPDAAMPLALKGAALAELGRTREAIAALEAAIERDGNLALAWHELAYAAFRAGEYSRALLVLDRAFTLEPHTDTLMLRGRILREAGQYDAAEVAFEGAQQSAEHDVPRRDAEREIASTRRAATLGKRKPKDFTLRERAFADLGAVLLDGGDGDLEADPGAERVAAALAGFIGAFIRLVPALDWRPAVCSAVLDEDVPLAGTLGRAIGAAVVPAAAVDPADRPLLVSVCGAGQEWEKQVTRLDRWNAGYTFALTQAPGMAEVADVIGTLRCPGDARAIYRHAERALLIPAPDTPGAGEITALAASPLARWRKRQSAAGY